MQSSALEDDVIASMAHGQFSIAQCIEEVLGLSDVDMEAVLASPSPPLSPYTSPGVDHPSGPAPILPAPPQSGSKTAESAQEAKESTAGKKRKRPRKNLTCACDLCKKRKVRCDGQKPCANCVKRKADCHYSPQMKRGFPSKASKAAKSAYDQSLAIATDTTRLNAVLSSYSTRISETMNLFSLKTSLIEVYFNHFYGFCFRLVPKDVIVYPRERPHLLMQTVAVAMAARSMKMIEPLKDLEQQIGIMAESVDSTKSLQVAKAYALVASYYHGQDLDLSDGFVKKAKRVSTRVLEERPNCFALQSEVSRLQLMLLSGSEFERRDTVNPWLDELQEKMGNLQMTPAPSSHECDKKPDVTCVDSTDLTFKSSPFKNFSLAEVIAGMGSAHVRQQWTTLTLCLMERRLPPPMSIEEAEEFLLGLLNFEGIWMANEDIGFLRPLFDLCFSVAVSGLFMSVGHYVEAEHYMYAALIQLDGLNKAGQQPGGTKMEQLPSWILAYVRLLFHVTVQAGRLAFSAEVVKLEFLLAQVLPRFREHYEEHLALLQELADKGVAIDLPVLDANTSFAPHKLPAAVGGPGVYVSSFEELSDRFKRLILKFPLSSLITTWLPVPQDPVAIHTPGFFHLWLKDGGAGPEAATAFVPSVDDSSLADISMEELESFAFP